MKKTESIGPKSTLDEATRKAKQAGHTHGKVQSHYASEVAAIEEELGPHIPALLTPQGRPRKGQSVEAAEVHTLRVKPSIWVQFSAKAKDVGLTANAAAQLALLEWSKR